MAKKLLILGATGGTGAKLVEMALAKGHEVTALVRDPARLGAARERVRVLRGSVPEDEATLAEAVRGQEVVISALGVGKKLKSGGLIGRSVPAIARAMEAQGVRRLILTSAYGVGDTWRYVPAVPRILMRLLFRDLYADKAAGEAALRDSALDWTVVYPVTLTDGPFTGRYRAEVAPRLRGFPRVSRADLAGFLLREAETPTFSRRGVLVSGA